MPHIVLDWEANRFWVDGQEVILSGTEYQLLQLLWNNRHRILTHDTIIDEIWVDRGLDQDRLNLNQHISRLRKKFPRLIITRRGIGYGILNGLDVDG